MIEQVSVYRSADRYCAFPDVELLADGEIAVVFRDAPRRARVSHYDSASRAVLVRSADGGRTWDPGAAVVAEGDPDVGIQDPSIRRLRDGRLVCTFFAWRLLRDEPHGAEGLGAFLVASADAGRTWDRAHTPLGRPAGVGAWVSTTDAVLELPDGALLAPVYENNLAPGERGGHRAFLRRSTDGGHTWGDWGTIAYDPLGNVDFEEPALARLPDGRLLCLLREDRRKECLWQAESRDDGATWSVPHRTPIWGHPAHLLPLASGRLLCTYGYRRPPYGVRACLSDDGGATWQIGREVALRADGLGTDLGYPSSVQLADGTIFTAYYDADADGVRFIAGCRYREW